MGLGLISKANKWRWIVLFLLFTFSVEAGPSKKVWEAVTPYLLPQDHPIKPLLDAIFSQDRVILNLETLKKAGFEEAYPRKFTKLIVTKHPLIPGYIFKLYLDAQRYYKDLPEYHYWILRIQGAGLLREMIAHLQVGDAFKVPCKWIYPLPPYPKAPKDYQTKFFILVEEDMDLVSKKDNRQLWSSSYITPKLLDNLLVLLKTLGLSDCASPDNIPFSIDGRIAFVDTQTFGQKEVDYKKLTPYLSKANQRYWKSITTNEEIIRTKSGT